MNYTYGFEKLRIWQHSKELAVDIYRLTNTFPSTEKFGLTNQLRRAVVSISSNIAEGYSRKSPKEKNRYTEIAYGSLLEVISQTEISKELGFIGAEDYLHLRKRYSHLSNMLKMYQTAANRQT